MNATSPLSQAAPPSPNPVQTAAAAASDPTDRGSGQDFARALSAAGGKPARKSATKEHNAASDGSALPPAGNQPPPAAAPAGSAAAKTQSGTSAVSGNGASTPGVPAPATAPAAGDQLAAPPLTSAAAEEFAGANPASAAADLRNLPPEPSSSIAGEGFSMPRAAGILAPPSAAPAQAAGPAQAAAPAAAPAAAAGMATAPAGAAAAPAPKITGGPASKADIAAATSAPTSAGADAGATQNAQAQAGAPSASDAADAASADAAAQVAMAAAMAQGASAPSSDSSASYDDLATPDTGVTLQGVAAANDAASPAPSGLAAHAAAAPSSASVTAATAASIVQAVSASANSGPTDKHSRDLSTDGSVDAAQLLTSNAPGDTASGPTPTFKVSAGVDTADFGQGVADRVSLMMDGNLTSAKLQVNPPALGPIEVRIALQGGHAQVWMSSHSAVTRDALESTAPKLREMLNSQGFAQVSVDISQRSFQDRAPQTQPQAYESVSAAGGNFTAPLQASAPTARSASALLDAYA